MTNAFKCNRCGEYSESTSKRTSYDYEGDLSKLIFAPNKGANFDICQTCKGQLLHLIREWWHGLAPN